MSGIDDLLAGVKDIGAAVSGVAGTVADTSTSVRTSYDKVIIARDGVAVTPAGVAGSDEVSPAIAGGEAAIDAAVDAGLPWYKNDKVLLAIAAVLGLVLVAKVVLRRRRGA